MIKRFKLLRNVAQFDSVDSGRNILLGRLTLIYAENGRGKSSLAAILRSLATGDPLPIVTRWRFGAHGPPHVVLEGEGGSSMMFRDGEWTSELRPLEVFDDNFVEQNVYSGLIVNPRQRQNLHDLVVGPNAAVLNVELQEHIERVDQHNQELRVKEAAIPSSTMDSLSVMEFCRLPARSDIEKDIKAARSNLEAAEALGEINSAPEFDLLHLPQIDVSAFEEVLQMDLKTLETVTLERIQGHFARLGQGGEEWVSDGMRRIQHRDGESSDLLCPFCAQYMHESSLVSHYRAYFSDAYSELKRTIAQTLEDFKETHNESVPEAFERQLRNVDQNRQFWTRFCEIEEFVFDTSQVFEDWRNLRDALSALVAEKQSSPLEKFQASAKTLALLTTYDDHLSAIRAMNQRIKKANRAIQGVKERAGSADVGTLTDTLNRLESIKSRHTPDIASACDAYLEELTAKSQTEKARDLTREKLNHHRQSTFSTYQGAVNQYLARFGAGFRLSNMRPANLGSGSTSTYDAQIGNESIPIGKSKVAPEHPSFGSVFSGGDRTTLAFAFFLASLDERQDLEKIVVVIDDPISSMDAGRALVTAQEIRRLTSKARQVIVLSHDKRFLCKIWEHARRDDSVALEIARVEGGSTLLEWNVAEDSLTEHDRRHRVLKEYYENGQGDQREVAREIRHHLEGFLRTAYPSEFPSGSSLGAAFLAQCRKLLGQASQILDQARLQELREILEYANRFHHDTNPAWAVEPILDAELRTFIKRALDFAKP